MHACMDVYMHERMKTYICVRLSIHLATTPGKPKPEPKPLGPGLSPIGADQNWLWDRMATWSGTIGMRFYRAKVGVWLRARAGCQ